MCLLAGSWRLERSVNVQIWIFQFFQELPCQRLDTMLEAILGHTDYIRGERQLSGRCIASIALQRRAIVVRVGLLVCRILVCSPLELG